MAKHTTRLECTNCDEIATITYDGLVDATYCPFCGDLVEIADPADDEEFEEELFGEDDDDY